ncbi:MAG: hypothetical protein LCI03_00205 [Actinobacteria bacterium]|nr:hypothetical protein [Actinomycetota bacterium]
MTQQPAPVPAFQLVGDADAPVCTDGVCAIPGVEDARADVRTESRNDVQN